jgi:hypothetical protein
MRSLVVGPTGVALLAAAACLAPPAGAHDLRLTPDRFQIAPAETVLLRLILGDHLRREESTPFYPQKILAFQELGPAGSKDLRSLVPGFNRPVHPWSSAVEGTHVLAIEWGHGELTLEPAKFTSYLEEEALDDIVELRARERLADQAGAERYSRSLKTIVQVGAARSAAIATRAVGQKLEIVPRVDPVGLKAGEAFEVRILFEGRPLPNRTVRCLVQGPEGLDVQERRSDAEGLVRFVLAAPGTTLIRLVHLRRAAPESGVAWESFWSALTFEALPPS